MYSKKVRLKVVRFCLHRTKGEPMRVLFEHEVSRLDGCPPKCSGALDGLVHLYLLAESGTVLDLGRFEMLVCRLDDLADQPGVAAFLYNEFEAVGNPDTVAAIRSFLNAPEPEVDLASLMSNWLSHHRGMRIGELQKSPVIGPHFVVDGVGNSDPVRNEH